MTFFACHRRSSARILVLVLLVSLLTLGMGQRGARAWAASPPSDTLAGEGGSFAEPIINQLLIDDTSGLAPLSGSYFEANIDQGRDDFADGSADFAVSELPLTSAETTTAQSDGRKFVYVPFAASAVSIGAIVICSVQVPPATTTSAFCPDLQLTMEELAGLFTYQIGTWNNATLLPTVSDGTGPVAPSTGTNAMPQNGIDPSTQNLILSTAFENSTTVENSTSAKTLWNAFVTQEGGSADESELWPTGQGTQGGDAAVVQKLIPINETTREPNDNPEDWGDGALAALPVDWLGPPESIPTIAIQNAAGAFVLPTPAAETAALNDATMDSSTNIVTFPVNGGSDATAYPMMAMSYLVVPTSGLSATKATALAQFIKFVLGSKGQQDIESFGAVPPTSAMVQAGRTVADEVAAEGSTTFSVTVNGSSSAIITPGATATLAEMGLPTSATGTVAFASGGTKLCTITLPATSCTTATSLAAGTYPDIVATYVDTNQDPGVAATNTLSLTMSSTTTTTNASSAPIPSVSGPGGTSDGNGSNASDASDSAGSSSSLAFTGGTVWPLAVLGTTLVVLAEPLRRRYRRRRTAT